MKLSIVIINTPSQTPLRGELFGNIIVNETPFQNINNFHIIQTNTEYRVLYAHTDKMGVVNNVRYFEYFEAGRNDFLRKLGYPYTELEKENFGLPVIEAYAKFIAGAKYDDVITIQTKLNRVPTVRFRIDYEVTCNEKIIVTGFTVHSFVSISKMKPVRPPLKFIDLIKSKFLKGNIELL